MPRKPKPVAATSGALPTNPFTFDSQAVRTCFENGQAWFVVNDVCAVLAINNPRDAIAEIDDEDVHVVSNDTNRGLRKLNAVNEAGLYQLIFRSRKPAAKRFLKWVAKEVLPQIRKTGQYQHPSIKAPEMPLLAKGDRLAKERFLGSDLAISANDTMGVFERYIAELTAITAIIDRSRTAARAFDAATILGVTQHCPHCRAPLPGLLSEGALDLAHLMTVKARELDIEWRGVQQTLAELHRLVRRAEGDAEEYLKETEANRSAEAPPAKH
jgi:prophage antirepressor-like protein